MATIQTRRVVITGMGAVTPAGFGVSALWYKLMAGECCITPTPDALARETGVAVAGQIPGYDPLQAGFTRKDVRRYPRFVQLAMIAADEAMAQAGFGLEAGALESIDRTRFACMFGSGIGGLDVMDREISAMNAKGAKHVDALFIPRLISNMAAGDLAIRYGLRGECSNVVTACATGTHSIGDAYRAIRFGYADRALAGGTEESISRVCLCGFSRLGALTKATDPLAASRPFDVRRAGFVAGEGAGALVLESLQCAQERGARILAEVVGFGSTGDGYHMTAPNPEGEGAVRAMRQALAEGGFGPEDVGHVNAHGTGTQANDQMESAAILALCGQSRGRAVPVVSVKGCTGHLLGAAGAVEAIVCALSVAQDAVPPTVGFAEPDPKCPVNVSAQPRRGVSQKVALSNSFGFGGHNGSLAIAPYRG